MGGAWLKRVSQIVCNEKRKNSKRIKLKVIFEKSLKNGDFWDELGAKYIWYLENISEIQEEPHV